MLKEFKEFITGGNVIEFAVAVIMAGAIGGVVKGFVDNIVMPVVGHFTGGTDFANMKIVLTEAAVNAEGAVTTAENAIMYGAWINTIVNLVIVGLVMFLIVKAYNKTKKPVEVKEEAPAGPSQEDLLAEIRDLLKK
ncbi:MULTISPECIES: large conductance mechanosensitive channel protein MscL [unclassified Algibacter]|uniref:large conductance mechanosensitive channel protein MscL n=1 Tax=unclassified Algibacter TaxID=2615009 RepID=UPI00131DC517|nr:large conductance mechanosensitive channel protein MscL [Algibacter sp. L3A6]